MNTAYNNKQDMRCLKWNELAHAELTAMEAVMQRTNGNCIACRIDQSMYVMSELERTEAGKKTPNSLACLRNSP